mgnify:CR=1 FL=1
MVFILRSLAAIATPCPWLPLEQVTGDLWFSDQETHFSNLTAKLWGQPLTLDYQGQQQADGYQVNLGMQDLVRMMAEFSVIAGERTRQ